MSHSFESIISTEKSFFEFTEKNEYNIKMFRLSVIGVFERRSDHIQGLSHSHSLAHTRSPSSHLFRIRLCHVSLFSLNICICSQLKTHILIVFLLFSFTPHTLRHILSHSLACSVSFSISSVACSISFTQCLPLSSACLSVCQSVDRSAF